MRTYRRLHVRLSRSDRGQVGKLLRGGLQPVRVVLRALALWHLDQAKSVAATAATVRLTSKAVRQIGRRYEAGGLERALHDKQRPGAAPRLDLPQRQRIIAMTCSDPPAGRARWTIRLIAEEAVQRRLAPRVGRETIRLLWQHHDLKPWREKNVVRRGAG